MRTKTWIREKAPILSERYLYIVWTCFGTLGIHQWHSPTISMSISDLGLLICSILRIARHSGGAHTHIYMALIPSHRLKILHILTQTNHFSFRSSTSSPTPQYVIHHDVPSQLTPSHPVPESPSSQPSSLHPANNPRSTSTCPVRSSPSYPSPLSTSSNYPQSHPSPFS
jgi:hypothetical protein